MKNKTTIYKILIVVLLTNGAIFGREISNRLPVDTKSAYAHFEFDPTFVLTGGYGRSFAVQKLNRNIELFADLGLPIFLIDLRHYRLSVSSRVALLDNPTWNVLYRVSGLNIATDNNLYKANALTVETGILPGYFRENWHLAAEINFQKNLATYLEHSDWSRKNVYADAKDGWYSSTLAKWIFGVQGSYALNQQIQISGRFAYYMNSKLGKPFGVPFLGNIALVYKFSGTESPGQ